jgi:hypothetical protein
MPLKELIDRLVDQFSDPYAFLRELVQNSLDAGSAQIDFQLEQQDETLILTCQDTGEGMDEQLIDSRLTRIFASSKEDDLTKVGQFGIGFLSLFAVQPDHIVVDTGRNGQFWRVHFTPDRTFSKTRLQQPVEGTRIRLVKHRPPRDFAQKCREALEHWCAHAEIRILWNGLEIGVPFDWNITGQASGIQVTLRPGQGFLGLYNRGLTLSHSQEELWPALDVKINSRYLSHTLTRDRVVRDHNFEKARVLVEQTIHEQLLPQLLHHQDLAGLAAHLDRLSPEQRTQIQLDPYHLGQIDGLQLVLTCSRVDPLVERLRQQRIVLQEQPGLETLLQALAITPLPAEQAYLLPELLKPTPQQHAWLRRLQRALERLGETCQRICLAELPSHLPVLPCGSANEPVPLKPGSGCTQLLLNPQHPLWIDLWELDPQWGEPALCQALWTAFPHLFPDELAKQTFAFAPQG